MARAVRAVQALIELASVPGGGEHFRRRPTRHVQALAFTVEEHHRFAFGIVEWLAARKPSPHHSRSAMR